MMAGNQAFLRAAAARVLPAGTGEAGGPVVKLGNISLLGGRCPLWQFPASDRDFKRL
jgi:hypothetical protein